MLSELLQWFIGIPRRTQILLFCMGLSFVFVVIGAPQAFPWIEPEKWIVSGVFFLLSIIFLILSLVWPSSKHLIFPCLDSKISISCNSITYSLIILLIVHNFNAQHRINLRMYGI